MASSVPYIAPYSRGTAQARPALRVDSPVTRFLVLCTALLLFYVVVQLSLASIASATLAELARLDGAIALAERQRDALKSEVETYKSPAYIEIKARAMGYGPLTNIEFDH